jgi:hypothetical protein
MIIPLAASEDGIKEWALVELQGKIEPQQDVDLQESLTVGTMQLSKAVRHLLSSTVGMPGTSVSCQSRPVPVHVQYVLLATAWC